MTDSRDFAQAAVRRAWLKQLLGPISETKWDELARELFAWQFAQVPAYRRLCLARNFTPENLASWRDIPAVPQQLFKQTLLYAHGSTSPAAIYVTSGTTTGKPGRQHLLDTDIYRAVSTGFLDRELELHFLTPSPGEAS
jgi:phenylacetate-coenzyme A ligase PaaK-like adenylate-forming protein